MTVQTTVISLIVLVLLGGGMYFYSMNTPDVMMEKDGQMMEKDSAIDKTMEAKDAMEKKDEMVEDEMKKDSMTDTKGDSMMEKDEGAVMEKEGAVMEKEGAMMAHGGTYEAFAPEKIAWAKDGKVVLFFRASWCPTCKAVDSDIRGKLSSIPKNITILDVNYDTETALKQKYGVTYQHTFVQVDASGNQIGKWSGSSTLAALLGNVK